MGWYRSNGVWKQPWEALDDGAGFADVVFSPEETAKMNAFLNRYESTEQRIKSFNGVGVRLRSRQERHEP